MRRSRERAAGSTMMRLLLLAVSAWAGPPEPKLRVSPSAILLPHSQMVAFHVGYPDANLIAVKDGMGYRFWMDGGNGQINGIPGRPWSFMKSNGLSLSVNKLVTGNVHYWETYPCPVFDGFAYKEPCVRDDKWHGGKALMWAGNVYPDRESGGILMFIHMEFTDPRPEAEMCYFRFALAYSENGGNNFTWLGYLAEPEVSYEHSVFGSKYGRPRWYPNMGLPNYIIKDGFFYVYYGDSHDLDPDGQVHRTTVGGAGNPDQGVAVIRAPVVEVLAAAKRHEVTPWMKYHNGSFSEPGMGGGRFTPLNLPPQGYMHGDAAWCAPLKQWVMVQQTGGRIRETKAWRKNIVLSFSSDGLLWTDWQVIFSVDSAQVVYPSLMSLDGLDNEILGQTFAVVFEYRGGNASSAPFQYNMVNVTVSLDHNKNLTWAVLV